MKEILSKYIPENAVLPCIQLIKELKIQIKIVNERKTRHGDFRKYPNGDTLITINASLNKYSFLITLIHEIAHYVCHKKYTHYIKPHGREWKENFSFLMMPFIREDIFPSEIIPHLQLHFRNPTATTDTDYVLSLALKKYNADSEKVTYIFQLLEGEQFRWKDGRIFEKKEKLIKRHKCIEIGTGKSYIFHPNAPVEIV